MRTSEDGTRHPEATDDVTAFGLEHIDNCPECHAQFGFKEPETFIEARDELSAALGDLWQAIIEATRAEQIVAKLNGWLTRR